jgi:hypothetical protein
MKFFTALNKDFGKKTKFYLFILYLSIHFYFIGFFISKGNFYFFYNINEFLINYKEFLKVFPYFYFKLNELTISLALNFLGNYLLYFYFFKTKTKISLVFLEAKKKLNKYTNYNFFNFLNFLNNYDHKCKFILSSIYYLFILYFLTFLTIKRINIYVFFSNLYVYHHDTFINSLFWFFLPFGCYFLIKFVILDLLDTR